jgi:hypothetical protein
MCPYNKELFSVHVAALPTTAVSARLFWTACRGVFCTGALDRFPLLSLDKVSERPFACGAHFRGVGKVLQALQEIAEALRRADPAWNVDHVVHIEPPDDWWAPLALNILIERYPP